MSLTKEAIQLITDTALEATGKTLATLIPTVVLPESSKVIDLERFQAGRSRFRGTYSTHSLNDFAVFVVERAAPGARGFINQDEMSCALLFNLGTTEAPGHADDRAVLRLKATAGYTAAQAIGARGISQKDLSDWIEDWHQYLTPVDEAGNAIPVAKAIAAVRTITIKHPANRKLRWAKPAPAAALWTRSRRAVKKPCRFPCSSARFRSKA